MTRDDVLALLERRDAAWAARDAAALASVHALDGVVVSPTGGVLEGRAEIERVYRVWLTAFPDIVVQRETAVIEGGEVAVLARFSATHAGEFFGMPASGRRIDALVSMWLTLAQGSIARERRVYDFTGLLVQTGVLKAKPVG